MALSMIGMWVGESKMMLYIAIALVGYGNSNVFSDDFQALLAMPDKKNEVSGLMIMGLFGGTAFSLWALPVMLSVRLVLWLSWLWESLISSTDIRSL